MWRLETIWVTRFVKDTDLIVFSAKQTLHDPLVWLYPMRLQPPVFAISKDHFPGSCTHRKYIACLVEIGLGSSIGLQLYVLRIWLWWSIRTKSTIERKNAKMEDIRSYRKALPIDFNLVGVQGRFIMLSERCVANWESWWDIASCRLIEKSPFYWSVWARPLIALER